MTCISIFGKLLIDKSIDFIIINQLIAYHQICNLLHLFNSRKVLIVQCSSS